MGEVLTETVVVLDLVQVTNSARPQIHVVPWLVKRVVSLAHRLAVLAIELLCVDRKSVQVVVGAIWHLVHVANDAQRFIRARLRHEERAVGLRGRIGRIMLHEAVSKLVKGLDICRESAVEVSVVIIVRVASICLDC